MAIAHVFGMGGVMANPFEFRELMKAQFHLGTTKTVEEVQAEHEQRHAEREQAARRRPARAVGSGPPPPASGVPRQAEIDKLKAMLARGKQAPNPPAE